MRGWFDASGRSSVVLAFFGFALLAGGFVYPGSAAAVATALIVAGAGQVSVAAILPLMREFELGPSGVKARLRDDDDTSSGLTVGDADPEELNRFAALVLGDSQQARATVEETLDRVRRGRRRIEAALTVRTLISALETSAERSWLRGGSDDVPRPDAVEGRMPSSAVIQALQELPFERRVAFLLRTDWSLPADQVATLVGRPLDEVERDIDTARKAVRPYLGSGKAGA